MTEYTIFQSVTTSHEKHVSKYVCAFLNSGEEGTLYVVVNDFGKNSKKNVAFLFLLDLVYKFTQSLNQEWALKPAGICKQISIGIETCKEHFQHQNV